MWGRGSQPGVILSPWDICHCLGARKTTQHHSNPSVHQPLILKKLKVTSSVKTYNTSKISTKKDGLFIIGDWNEKIGSQEIPRITEKFGLEVQNEVRQRLTKFCHKSTLMIANTLSNNPKTTLHMDITRLVSTKIILIYVLCS